MFAWIGTSIRSNKIFDESVSHILFYSSSAIYRRMWYSRHFFCCSSVSICVYYTHIMWFDGLYVIFSMHYPVIALKWREWTKTIKWLIINAKWWQFAHEIDSFTSSYDLLPFTCALTTTHSQCVCFGQHLFPMNVFPFCCFVDSTETFFLFLFHIHVKIHFAFYSNAVGVIVLQIWIFVFPSPKLGSYLQWKWLKEKKITTHTHRENNRTCLKTMWKIPQHTLTKS